MSREPLYRVELRERKSDDGEGSYLSARVDPDLSLVLEGYDYGKSVEEFWGDSDYEYVRVVRPEDMPRVLLELLKDRFEKDSDFSNWLEEKGIPSQFQSWV
jgi:hypothetical protein